MDLKFNTYNEFFNSDKKYHILFILILLLNYFFPLIIFGEITLFYHDKLDAGVVYNYVIGEYYRGDQNAFDKFT